MSLHTALIERFLWAGGQCLSTYSNACRNKGRAGKQNGINTFKAQDQPAK